MDALRRIPSIDRLLALPSVRPLLESRARSFVADALRAACDEVRCEIRAGREPEEPIEETIVRRAGAAIESRPRSGPVPVVNATGIVLHTNLGRALLPEEAVSALVAAARGPIALEYDVDEGRRGDRDDLVEEDLRALTGAEAATVVNNNAAAVVLALNSLAEGREVIVSRGELIEIGGSFRIPEMLAKSGARLREVGTTNRTHAKDYAEAIGPETGAILKVHTSNYRIVGFTAEVGLEALVEIGRGRGVPVIEDLGSGALVDLSRFGLRKEPVVGERVAAGADLVTFSGDKLLGGPQAGLVVGRRELVERIRRNPLKRALRAGKLTLAALSAVLRLYRQSTDLAAELPTLRWLLRSPDEMERVGREALPLLRAALGDGYEIELVASTAEVGSGALPTTELPSLAIAIRHAAVPAERIARRFRSSVPPIVGRIRDESFLLDLRGVFDATSLRPRR